MNFAGKLTQTIMCETVVLENGYKISKKEKSITFFRHFSSNFFTVFYLNLHCTLLFQM